MGTSIRDELSRILPNYSCRTKLVIGRPCKSCFGVRNSEAPCQEIGKAGTLI